MDKFEINRSWNRSRCIHESFPFLEHHAWFFCILRVFSYVVSIKKAKTFFFFLTSRGFPDFSHDHLVASSSLALLFLLLLLGHIFCREWERGGWPEKAETFCLFPPSSHLAMFFSLGEKVGVSAATQLLLPSRSECPKARREKSVQPMPKKQKAKFFVPGPP